LTEDYWGLQGVAANSEKNEMIVITLAPLHFATAFNGLMGQLAKQHESVSPSKTAAIETNNIVTVACFKILLFNLGLYGLFLFAADLLVSIYLIKIKKN
jgi:hypothetical protein